MSEYDHFTAHEAGEEAERLIEHKYNPFLDASLAPSSAQASQAITKVATAKVASASLVLTKQTVANALVLERAISTRQYTGTGLCAGLQRLYSSIILPISDHTQQRPSHRPHVDFSTLTLQDPPLLCELLAHMHHMLLLAPFAFSKEEQQHVLEAAEQMARENGLFSLGLALFMADRQPHGLIACLAAPHFSSQRLHTWVKQECEKIFHQEAKTFIASDTAPDTALDTRKTGRSERMAKMIATMLTTRVGCLNAGLLEDLPAFLSLISPTPHDAHPEWLEQRLKGLRDSPLRQKVQSIKVAELHPMGAACIRATWNTPQEDPLTYREICKTLLATFLSPLRQQKGEEDCFAVAVMISAMEESPQQALDDLCALLRHGALTRMVDGKPIVFPWLSTEKEQEYSLPLQYAWRRVVASMSEAPRQGTCAERFVAATMPLFHTLGAEIGSSLEGKVQMLLRDSFRWIYQPSSHDPESSLERFKGSFALYAAQGNTWKKITSAEELSQALEDFTQEAWPEEPQRAEKQRFLHAQLATEGVALSLINRYRLTFQVEKVSGDVDPVTLHCTPWITYTRGNAESVWRTYHEEQVSSVAEGTKSSFSEIPETGEKLIALLMEWLRWHISQHPRMQAPHRLTVRIEDVHAFSVLPTHWLLKLASETETVSLEKWIKRHLKDPLVPLNQATVSPETREKLIRFALQHLVSPTRRRDVEAALHALEHPLSIYALRHRVCELVLQGQSPDSPDRVDAHTLKEIQQSIDAHIIELLPPQEKTLLEANALMIGDSNWSDEQGKNRYFYLALHPGSNQISLFLGDLDKGNHEPLNLVLLPSHPWLSQRWQLLEKKEEGVVK